MRLMYIIMILILVPMINAEFIYDRTINGTGKDGSDENDLFDQPVSLWINEEYIYVVDNGDNYLIFVDEDDNVFRKLGDSDKEVNRLYEPTNVFIREDKVYISESDDVKIYEKKPNLNIFSSSKNFYSEPYAITFLDGKFYIVDKRANRIYLHNEDESYDSTYINYGRFSGEINGPSDIFVGPDGLLYLADTGNDRIQVLYSNFSFVRNIGKGRGGVQLNKPEGVFVSEKFVFVADTGNNRIVVFDILGNPLETLEPLEDEEEEEDRSFDYPKDVFYFEDKVYIADTENSRIEVYDFELELPKDTTYDRLTQVYEQLKEIEEVINKSEELGVTIETDLNQYYKQAEFYYLESKYNETEQELDKFEENYEDELKNINNILKNNLEDISQTLIDKANYYSAQFDISQCQTFFVKFDNAYEEESYFEAVDYLHAINIILSDFEDPEESNIETDEMLTQRYNENEKKLETLEYTIDTYKQDIQLTSLKQKLDVAKSYLDIGDLPNTQKSLDSFDTEFDIINSSFSETKEKIDQALNKIYEVEQLNNPLFTRDVEKAKTIVYEDPDSAKEIAEKMLDGSSSYSIQIAFLIIVIVIIVALFLSHKVFKKAKRGR